MEVNPMKQQKYILVEKLGRPEDEEDVEDDE